MRIAARLNIFKRWDKLQNGTCTLAFVLSGKRRYLPKTLVLASVWLFKTRHASSWIYPLAWEYAKTRFFQRRNNYDMSSRIFEQHASGRSNSGRMRWWVLTKQDEQGWRVPPRQICNSRCVWLSSSCVLWSFKCKNLLRYKHQRKLLIFNILEKFQATINFCKFQSLPLRWF